MKKPSREKNGEAIHIKNRHPGGMWGGILNVLNYNYHWRYVKKRLPLRRLGSSKHTNCHGNCRNAKANYSDGLQNQPKFEGDNNVVNRKTTSFIPVARSSVLSRLKSLVVHDKSRRKGQPQYHRSSTYHEPTIPNPNSTPQIETKDLVATSSIISRLKSFVVEDKSRRKEQPQYCRSSTYHAPTIPNPNSAPQIETKDLAVRSSIISRLKSFVVVDKSKRKGLPKLHRSSTYNAPTIPNPNSAPQTEPFLAATDSEAAYQAQQLTNNFLKKPRSRRQVVDASLCDSEEFIDALSLTNIEESVLEKIVQSRDPCSPRRSYSHVAFSRPELQRCGTFPSPRLSGSRVSEDNKCCERCDEVVPDTFVPVVVPRIKDIDRSVTQCKDIKEKFTRLDDKKEEQRIAIDGVLDKIPKDREGISDETKRELFWKWAKKSRRRHKEAGTSKNERRYFKRNATSDDSNVGRYCKLFKSLIKETKPKDNNTLKPEEEDTSLSLPDGRPLARILSLPDLRSCSFRSEDSCRSSIDLYEVRIRSEVSLGLKLQSELESYIENESKAKPPIENEPNCEDAGGIDVIELTMEPSTVDAFDPSSEDHELEPAGTGDFDKHENPETSKDQDTDSFVRPIQVRPKDLDVFNYVRDVLELSGFSGNETLRMWHTDNQPLDPEMFEEVEFRCLLTGPKSYIGSQNHLLCIFDLINEVLIDIYRSSVTYWPVPLTRHCRVHPMPFRHHVLEHVWDNISSYLISIHDPTPDDFVSKDLERSDGWTNLQLESECVGLEIDDLIFDELMDDLIFDDLLEELIRA